MYHKQRYRLLRKGNDDPWTADQLAQELHSMFGPEVPLSHEGPIDLQMKGNNPFFYLSNFQTGDIVMQFKGRQGQPIGDLVLTDEGLGFQPEGQDQPVVVAQVGASNAFPAEVVSGSGSTYVVDTYPNGVNMAAVRVNAAPWPEPDDIIPAGTKIFVVRTQDGSHYIQVPTWL